MVGHSLLTKLGFITVREAWLAANEEVQYNKIIFLNMALKGGLNLHD